LRATGALLPERRDFDPGPLTAQEREIASLAATGLTNKQIGEKLFLSHRTVGTHLYRVFPKLGISSRAALRDALTALPRPAQDGASSAVRSQPPRRAWTLGPVRLRDLT
jgi:DNA-binding CsgD family transcriptional regulator